MTRAQFDQRGSQHKGLVQQMLSGHSRQRCPGLTWSPVPIQPEWALPSFPEKRGSPQAKEEDYGQGKALGDGVPTFLEGGFEEHNTNLFSPERKKRKLASNDQRGYR